MVNSVLREKPHRRVCKVEHEPSVVACDTLRSLSELGLVLSGCELEGLCVDGRAGQEAEKAEGDERPAAGYSDD